MFVGRKGDWCQFEVTDDDNDFRSDSNTHWEPDDDGDQEFEEGYDFNY